MGVVVSIGAAVVVVSLVDVAAIVVALADTSGVVVFAAATVMVSGAVVVVSLDPAPDSWTEELV